MEYTKIRKEMIIGGFIVILLAAGNLYLFLNKKPSTLGMAINEVDFGGLSLSKIFFILQWVLVLIIAIVLYVKNMRKNHEDKVKIHYEDIKVKGGKGCTDIDALYQLLKTKRKLKLSVISNVFKVEKEKVLEWCRILEGHDLVKINYPAFSEPEVEVNDEKETKE